MFKHLFFSSEWHFYSWREKKNTKQIFELFLHMLLKFNIIYIRTVQIIRLMISIFLKHTVYPAINTDTITRWNNKIVILKKKTLQLYFKIKNTTALF